MRAKLAKFIFRAVLAFLSIPGGKAFSTFLEMATSHRSARAIARLPTGRNALFYCPNKLCRYRVDTLYSKEPETIEWINGFDSDQVFWDVGANIGLYSIYAALERSATVVAFEPSPINFSILAQNIFLNRADTSISAFCIALSDRPGLSYLNMPNMEAGGALSAFGESIDFQGKRFKPMYRSAIIGQSIDDFIDSFSPPFPNHIKIDVDGLEPSIIRGARETLRDHRVQSLSIELDDTQPRTISDVRGEMECAGFSVASKRRAPNRSDPRFTSSHNWLFTRARPREP